MALLIHTVFGHFPLRMRQSRTWLIGLLLLSCWSQCASAASVVPDPAYTALRSDRPVQDQVFYLFTALEQVPEAKVELAADPDLRALATRRAEVLRHVDACRPQPACLLQARLWNDDDIRDAGAALQRLGRKPVLGRALVQEQLRPSGYFLRYADQDDAGLLRSAWEDAARGINGIIRTYGLGEVPRYPAIDAISFDTARPEYAALIRFQLDLTETPADAPFFQSSLELALGLLYLNGREDAGRGSEQPSAVAARIAATDFSRYPYTALLVLGAGPEVPGERLSAQGKLRLQRAAQLWKQGGAPFVIVSGGSVHPAHTPFVEAFEMRDELVHRYRIPADAIVVDPLARHTTTNFRNAARLMFRLGLPLDRDALAVTSREHSDYVAAAGFAERCRRELGYLPMTLGKRISAFEQVFRVRLDALQRDASDPLDP